MNIKRNQTQSNKMPSDLALLKEAAKLVNPGVVSNCNSLGVGDDIKYVNERSFAYDLYRHWQTLVEKTGDDVIVNAEVTKKIEEKYLPKLRDIFGFEKNETHHHFEPDLVLHNSQSSSIDQRIICEIKIKDRLRIVEDVNSLKTDNNLYRDLLKLKAYITKDNLLYNPFKYGVFILAGGSFETIKKGLGNTIPSELQYKKHDIYCMMFNIKEKNNMGNKEYDSYVECKSLAQIFSK